MLPTFDDKLTVQKAFRLADRHHSGIRRKFTGEPYIEHPKRIVGALLGYGEHEQDVLAAAFLHDCMEDKNLEGLRMRFSFIASEVNGRVAKMVEALTKPSRGSKREDEYIRQLHRAPLAVRKIKLCDIIDNCRGLAELSPEFAKPYLVSKAVQVTHLNSPELKPIAYEAGKIIADGLNFLSVPAKRRAPEEIEAALAAEAFDWADIALF